MLVGKVQVAIEEATIKQLKQLLDLERECFTIEAYSEKQISRLLQDPKQVALLAKVDGDIAGFIIGLVEDFKKHKLGHVVTIDVAPKYRRRNVGSILLEKIEAIFSRKGAEAVYLEVRVDNKSARQLYSKHGYKESAALEDYYSVGAHGLRLIKRLGVLTSS